MPRIGIIYRLDFSDKGLDNQVMVITKDKDDFQKHINENDYAKAKAALIKNSKISEPIKQYNLGYIEYQSGNYTQARILLESAKSQGLYSKELLAALERVKSKLQVKQVESQASMTEKVIIESLSYSEDLILSLMALGVFGATIFLYFSKKMAASIIAVLTIPIISFYFMVYKNYQLSFAMTEADIFTGPSRIFEQTQRTIKGMKLVVDKHDGDWQHIVYPKHFSGWAYKLEVKTL